MEQEKKVKLLAAFKKLRYVNFVNQNGNAWSSAARYGNDHNAPSS